MTRSPRRLEIDGLRAVAAIWVMCDHFGLSNLVGMHYGFIAVRLMLVLSAYFAAKQLRSLWSTKSEPASGEAVASKLVHYYTSRVVRLGLVAYTTILLAVLFNADMARGTWKWHASFATNEWIARNSDWPGCLSHFWTLAVQMQFLLLLPVVILIICRRRLKLVLFAGILAAIGHRACVVFGGVDDYFRWMPIANSLDSFCIGIGLAWMEQERPKWFAKLATPGAAIAAVAVMAGAHWMRGIYYTPLGILTETSESIALAVLFGAMLGGRTFGPVGAFLRWKPMVKMGAASLSLYALHPIVERLLSRMIFGLGTHGGPVSAGLWFQFLAAGSALLAAWGGYLLIETPARKISTMIESGAARIIPRLFASPWKRPQWTLNMRPVGMVGVCFVLFYGATAALRLTPPSVMTPPLLEELIPPLFLGVGEEPAEDRPLFQVYPEPLFNETGLGDNII